MPRDFLARCPARVFCKDAVSVCAKKTQMTQKPFDPIRLLRELSRELLRALLVREGIDDVFPDEDSPGVDPGDILSVWDSLSDNDRGKLHVALHEIHSFVS